MITSLVGGRRSRHALRVRSSAAAFASKEIRTVNTICGSDVTGNIGYATDLISPDTSTTFTTIRSSMGWHCGPWIGNGPQYTALFVSAYCHEDGPQDLATETMANDMRIALEMTRGGIPGFRFASPRLRMGFLGHAPFHPGRMNRVFSSQGENEIEHVLSPTLDLTNLDTGCGGR